MNNLPSEIDFSGNKKQVMQPSIFEEEKIEIAKRHLLPKQVKEHGLSSKEIKIGKRVSRIYINDIDLGELERSQVRSIIEQLDNLID